jgi:tetrahydromethanopterin S-methyltransferase subunit B
MIASDIQSASEVAISLAALVGAYTVIAKANGTRRVLEYRMHAVEDSIKRLEAKVNRLLER